MKRFLFVLALGLAAADKLDRTYLPPPGSKYAGGQPGDLQVPLEFPKESYTTTAPFTPRKIVPGLAQTPVYSERPKGLVSVTPASKSPFNYNQNSYKVPTTTTSYAFTQTTTFPPTESFETTPSSIGSGFPIDGSLSQQPSFVNQPFSQGQILNQQTGHIPPEFVQPGNPNVFEAQNSFPGSQTISRHPGYTEIQNTNQYQQGLPVSTISPILGSSFQPDLVSSSPYDQGNTQHQGVQPPRQFVQKGLIPSSTAASGYQSNFPSQYDNVSNIQGTRITGQQSPISSTTGLQQASTQYIDKYGNVQSTVPSYTVSHQGVQGPLLQPSQPPYGGDLNSIPGTFSPVISSQQDAQRPQSIGTQGTVTEFIPGQQKETGNGEFLGQHGVYQSPEQYQVTNIPGLPVNLQQGQSQQFGALHPYLPGLGSQHPQYQQTASSSGIPQETATSTGPSVDQFQRDQRLQFGGQQTIYPSTGIPDTITQHQLGGHEPQFNEQQGAFPSSVTPERQVLNRGSQQLQQTGQQNIFPGTSQGYTTFGQTGSQFEGHQPQITGQSFPTPSNSQPGFYQQRGKNNQGSNIFASPGDSRISSQSSFTQRPEDQNIITSGPMNIYGTSTTRPVSILPSDYRQPYTPSTLAPSTIASFGTTPGSIYPSSTSSYPGSESIPHSSINAKPPPDRPQAESDRNAVILNFETVLTPEGYAYSFDTSNGIHADENGTAIDGVKANGSYSYIGDDGKLYSVVYTADENGFRPHGDHFPTPPPIPKAIQRVIEQAAKDKEAGISHDGFYDDAKYGHKKYRGQKHHRPEEQDKIINGADIPDNYENDYDNNATKSGERKPISSKNENNPIEYDDTGYDSEEDISEKDQNIKNQPNRKIPTKRPITKTPEQIKNINNQDKHRVTGIGKHTLEYPTGQQMHQRRPLTHDSPKRHPQSSGRKGKPVSSEEQNDNEENYDNKEVLEDGEGINKKSDRRVPSKSFEKNIDEGSRRIKLPFEDKPITARPQEVKRPVSYNPHLEDGSYNLKQTIRKDNRYKKPSKGPSKTFGLKYQVTDKSSEDQEDSQERSKNYGLSIKQRLGMESRESYLEDTNYPKGSRFGQKYQPSSEESSTMSDNESEDEETGYQYSPPQNKFYQGETNRFPSRFSDKATSKRPVTKYIDDKRTTARPFITPNVQRNEDDIYDDVSEENIAIKGFGKFTGKMKVPGPIITYTTPEYEYETTDYSSEYSSKESQPEVNTSSKIHQTRPEKVGSTRRPGYQSQKTTGKPEYYEEYTFDDEEKVPERGSKRPGQKNRNYHPLYSDIKTPQGRPGQNFSQTISTSREPTYTYSSSTTPMPFRKSKRPGSKQPSQQEEEQIQYITTYEPTDTSTTDEEEYTEDTTNPGYSTSKSIFKQPITKLVADDVQDSTKIPFSRPTSRPSFDYSDEAMISGSPMIRPGITESAYGGPLTRPNSSKIPGYLTTKPISKVSRPDTGAPIGPGFTADSYLEKNKPSSVTVSSESGTPEKTGRPGVSQTFGQSGPHTLPTTTYRPNYSITDMYEPGSVTVDAFGRPLQTLSGNRRPVVQAGLPGSTIPRFPVSPSQKTQSTGPQSYQDSGFIRPGQQGSQVDGFKPTEPRFGGPVQGSLGPKPAEFGPSSVTTPGYLSPYGHPTEKVVGEDFSGPKQQQKFDPETGYYY